MNGDYTLILFLLIVAAITFQFMRLANPGELAGAAIGGVVVGSIVTYLALIITTVSIGAIIGQEITLEETDNPNVLIVREGYKDSNVIADTLILNDFGDKYYVYKETE